jgi:hypothetical protein
MRAVRSKSTALSSETAIIRNVPSAPTSPLVP